MSEDRDRLDRLSAPSTDPTNDEGIPIPVHVEKDPKAAAEAALRRAEEETRQGRDIVQEYEERYYGPTSETARQRRHAEELASGGWQATGQRAYQTLHQYDWRPRSLPVDGLSDDERLWAALAHISALLTIGVAIVTNGLAVLAMIFVPLAIYFYFRDKSNFVAFHALQAFAMQLLGTMGWVVVLVAGILVLTVGIVISALASVVLIGIPFLIVFVLLLVAFLGVMLALPFGMLIFSLIGAYQTYNGRDYRYPFIASWIERQLSSSFLA